MYVFVLCGPRFFTHNMQDNIVGFVDFRPKPSPLLIMEYLPLGNLEDQHRASPIAFEETLTIWFRDFRAWITCIPTALPIEISSPPTSWSHVEIPCT